MLLKLLKAEGSNSMFFLSYAIKFTDTSFRDSEWETVCLVANIHRSSLALPEGLDTKQVLERGESPI